MLQLSLKVNAFVYNSMWQLGLPINNMKYRIDFSTYYVLKACAINGFDTVVALLRFDTFSPKNIAVINN